MVLDSQTSICGPHLSSGFQAQTQKSLQTTPTCTPYQQLALEEVHMRGVDSRSHPLNTPAHSHAAPPEVCSPFQCVSEPRGPWVTEQMPGCTECTWTLSPETSSYVLLLIRIQMSKVSLNHSIARALDFYISKTS